MVDIKTSAIYFPFVASCFIGMMYAVNTKVLSVVPLQTYVFVYCIAGAVILAILHFISPFKLDFSAAAQWPFTGMIAASVALSLSAWLLSLITIREISATYAALGEISYPLFTAFFTYLFFQSRELDWRMVLGGLLILTGSVLVLGDKIGKN